MKYYDSNSILCTVYFVKGNREKPPSKAANKKIKTMDLMNNKIIRLNVLNHKT